MPRRWCWWRNSRMRLAVGLSALLIGSFPGQAATLLEKSVAHHIQTDGSILESIRLQVRLETSADVDDWATYPIYLDDHRSLVEIDTWAVTPAGERVVVKKKEHDTTEFPGAGILAGSRRYRLVEFPRLPPGSVLHISHTVREQPYHRSGSIPLGGDDTIATLEVEVDGPPELRFRLDGEAEGWGPESFRLEERQGRVRVVGEGLPAVEPPPLAPGDAGSAPVLRYGWDGVGTWSSVALWYQGLLDGLKSGHGPSSEVAEQTRRLTAGLTTPRQRLDALLSQTSAKVRYVAVEMGIGGFVPTAPGETLARGWGDCKDKALLLVEMLGDAGIEAYPALVLSARNRRIDREFPSPGQFNHAIVAVPVGGQELAVEATDPVAGGYLFLDPTDEDGTSHWLSPPVQDQDALVVRGDRSELVRTPGLFRDDLRELRVDLALDADGGAAGNATLVLAGRYGDGFRRLLSEVSSARAEDTVRQVMTGLLPGVDLTNIGWGDDAAEGAPRTLLSAKVALPGLIQGEGDRRSFQLPGLSGTPDLETLEDRTVPVVLSPGVVHETWHLALPNGVCPPERKSWSAANDLGSFEQTVAGEDTGEAEGGQVLAVERRLELDRRWVEPDQVAALRELALAETRARKRRLRFGDCEP
jgi:transglutaminase-like putative cysteine protease